MNVLYFAWLRTKIGIGEEMLELPEEVTTVSEFLDWLGQRGPAYRDALQDRSVVRVAVNQEYVTFDHVLAPDDEVALFPPVTGGLGGGT
ncbi:MAG: molybdopterin converting factor subunit 1 [Rhodospirillaceae bacterium]|nr:molybdopterin converting factor subunit 1 [Rhodospirillaceae bacterium]|tara:strand:- start:2225 stop:2491 length:267 start_codon:yes stop_codon:yes gene_type:complete